MKHLRVDKELIKAALAAGYLREDDYYLVALRLSNGHTKEEVICEGTEQGIKRSEMRRRINAVCQIAQSVNRSLDRST